MEQRQGQITSESADRMRSKPPSSAPLRRAWPWALTAGGAFAIAYAGVASLGSTTIPSQPTPVHRAGDVAQAHKAALRTHAFAPPAPMTMEETLASSTKPTADDGACIDCSPFAVGADRHALDNQAVAHRLAAPVQQEWQYDELGNITFNTHRGTYHYEDSAHPMRVTKVSGGGVGTTRTYAYDAVGNQTVRPGAKVTYNERNLPARLLRPDGTVLASFLYGPGGERVRKTSLTGSLTSVRGLYELHRNGSSIEHRLIVPGIAILPYKQNGNTVIRQQERYPHTDHLGSTIAITAADDPGVGLKATVKEVRSYDPFGLARNPDWKTGSYAGVSPALSVQGYTGHNDDTELGLIDMKGRIYDPLLGRFLTTDPLISDMGATQPWHPYAYVDNNPLRYTDPSGFLKCSAIKPDGRGHWVCSTGGGGEGGSTGGGEYDLITGTPINVHVKGANGDPNEGPDGHAADERELTQFFEEPINQSGQHTQQGTSGGSSSSSISPGIRDSGVDPYIQATCEAQSWSCAADEVTVVGKKPGAAPDAFEFASGIYLLPYCDRSNASCHFDSEFSQDYMERFESELKKRLRKDFKEGPDENMRIEPDRTSRIAGLKEWDRWTQREKLQFLRDPSKMPHQNWYRPELQEELHRIREEAGNGGIYRPLETLIPQPRFPESPYGTWDRPGSELPTKPIFL
jgi:RHS repeat-associated protein